MNLIERDELEKIQVDKTLLEPKLSLEATEKLKELASEGNAEAKFELSFRLGDKWISSYDQALSERYLFESARQGHPLAVAMCWEKQLEEENKCKLLKLADEVSHPRGDRYTLSAMRHAAMC